MAKKLSEAEISALVANGIRQAEDHDKTDLAKSREKALEYISGKMSDTPAEVGRSSVVSRDVADTIGWILPGIMRVFTASDHFAKVDAATQRDEQFADQATDGVNYVFLKKNDGYKIIYDATYDALACKNGVVKTYWDETPEYETSFHSGLSSDQLSMLIEGDDVEVLAHTPTEIMEMAPDPMTGEMMPISVSTHEVKIKRQKSKGRIVVEVVPPEDFGMDGNATGTEDARFMYHMEEKTRSELIAMGFDREKIDDLQTANHDGIRDTLDNRDNAALDPSVEVVDLYECFFEADIDGDGSSELVRAYWVGNRGGGTMLDWELWEDENPFDFIPCTPIPHRADGESIADETMDVQRIKTVLLRQALDNIYATNLPRYWAPDGSILNPDEFFSPKFGSVIWGAKNSQVPPMPLVVPFVADKAFAAIDYQDQVIQRRTGVNRQTAALDPEALVNQSATANQNEKDASYSQIEQIARNMAEMGWKKVFRKILRLMIKHQDKSETIRLRDKWVEIDPRFWNADMDVTINVGLGTGSRDRDLAMLQGIFGMQNGMLDRFGQLGMMDAAYDMLDRMIETLSKIAESSGIKTPEMFFPDITPEMLQQAKGEAQKAKQQGDPKMAMEGQKLQMQMQADQAKMQADQQGRVAEFQFEQRKHEAQQQADMRRTEMEFAFKGQQLQQELLLKREQLQAELNLKRELEMERLAMQRDLGIMGNAMKASVATSGVSIGGEPG